MMVYLRTCNTCAHAGDECATRDALKVEAKRLGITSMKHRCAAKEPMFVPGDPIMVLTYAAYPSGDESYEDRPPQLWFPGHFVCWSSTGQPVVFVSAGAISEDGDDEWPFEPNGNGYIKAALSRVKRREGDRVNMEQCTCCAVYPGLGEKCGSDPAYRPPTYCLISIRARGEATSED